jgi:penicillin-binding protein 2
VFKIVTLSAALSATQIKPEDTFVCTGKWDRLGKSFEKKCWLPGGHGRINLIDGLTQSCDVVFYELGLALHKQDPQLLPNWARAYGLGVSTDLIGLTESEGIVPDDAWTGANSTSRFLMAMPSTAPLTGYMLCTPPDYPLLAAIATAATSALK